MVIDLYNVSSIDVNVFNSSLNVLDITCSSNSYVLGRIPIAVFGLLLASFIGLVYELWFINRSSKLRDMLGYNVLKLSLCLVFLALWLIGMVVFMGG